MYTLVEYAYPTSNTAKKWGFGETGCYTVVTCPDASLDGWQNIAAYAAKAQADRHADELGLPLHPIVVRYGQSQERTR